ncbi:MAG TPA: ABC transporter ATP-binding protein [Planctomycetota bacterium]|nr:ABC transporter ATP-binding protein [Planctomycetota bacterium]
MIEVERLAKSYDGVRAAGGVSFTVAAGEAVALMGPNGSGKTTILRCIAGLLRPDEGTIRVDGLDLRREGRAAHARMAFLPQQPAFAPSLTPREIAEFHARLRGLPRERAVAALRETGLAPDAGPAGTLSGGMRQRLALAVASLAPVRAMLLDEPTASLDPEAAIDLRRRARRWREEGRALLFATHVLDDVAEVADRVVVLVAGRKVAEERVADLLGRMRGLAVLKVDVERPAPVHVEAALAAGATRARLNGHAVIVTAPIERRYAILRRLGEVGPVGAFETHAPSVEEMYLAYLREGRDEGA